VGFAVHPAKSRDPYSLEFGPKSKGILARLLFREFPESLLATPK